MKTSKIRRSILVFIATLVVAISVFTQPVAATSEDVINISTVSLKDKCGLRTSSVLPLQEVNPNYIFPRKNDSFSKGSAIYNSPWDRYSTRYYYNQLNDKEKRFYDYLDAMCSSFLNESKDCQEYQNKYYTDLVLVPGLNQEDMWKVVRIFYYSNPQYYFLNLGNVISGLYLGNTYACLEVYEKFASGTERKKATDVIEKTVKDWYAKINLNASEVEKEKQIHDIIVSKTQYIAGAFDQSIYSTFVQGQTVCAGYAQAFQLLCNGAGIDCAMVTSTYIQNNESTGHAWNKVRINDSWYEVDCTWDDTIREGEISYIYFNRSCDTVINELDLGGPAHREDELWDDFEIECTIDTGSTHKSPGTVQTPSKTVQAPTINYIYNDGSTTITFTTEPKDAKIYYTIDGSEPSEAYSKAYRYNKDKPLTIDAKKTIKAIAVKNGYRDSTISSSKAEVKYFYAYAPVFTNEPSGFTCYYGSTGNKIGVSVATTGMGKLSYQWYQSSTKSYKGKAIKGATKATYSPSSLKPGTYYYYCIVTNTDNAAMKIQEATSKSAIAKITVIKTPISKVSIKGVSAKTYTGKAITQKPKITYGSLTLTKGKDYTISYSNNKAVGKAKVTITGKGNFSGKKTVTFKINPKGTVFSSKSIGKKRVILRWKRNSTVSGYQIQYAANTKFTSAKTKQVGSNKTTSLTISNLNSKKTYSVRIRTYKKVSGTMYYSSWSKPVKVKVK